MFHNSSGNQFSVWKVLSVGMKKYAFRLYGFIVVIVTVFFTATKSLHGTLKNKSCFCNCESKKNRTEVRSRYEVCIESGVPQPCLICLEHLTIPGWLLCSDCSGLQVLVVLVRKIYEVSF